MKSLHGIKLSYQLQMLIESSPKEKDNTSLPQSTSK